MPDNASDEPGGRPPGGGSRRSGLDRLRAARGSADEPTGGDRPASEATSASAARDGASDAGRGRASLLLDEPRDADATADASPTAEITTDTGTDADNDTDTADGSSDTAGVGRGRRSRRRAAAASAPGGGAGAVTTPGSPTRPEAGSAGAAGAPSKGRRGRIRRTGAATAASGPASRRQKVAALLLGVVIIGLLVPVVIMRHRIVGQTREEKAVSQLINKRTVALTTARQFAVTFFSPDYKTIDDYNKAVLAGSTGQFNQDFASKQADLKSLVTKAQSKATGRILTAGVSKVTGDDVEVLVVADQDVQNALTKGKVQTLRTRVRVTVHRTDKGWLVSGFEPVT